MEITPGGSRVAKVVREVVRGLCAGYARWGSRWGAVRENVVQGGPLRNGLLEPYWNDQVHKLILQVLRDALRQGTGLGLIMALRPVPSRIAECCNAIDF